MATSELQLRDMSKGELVEKIVRSAHRARSLVKKEKATIKRAGLVLLQGGVATAAGFAAGAMQVKMPTIGATPLRTDLVGAVILSGLNLANVFEEGSAIAQSAADALTGHGMGRVSEEFLRQRGF